MDASAAEMRTLMAATAAEMRSSVASTNAKLDTLLATLLKVDIHDIYSFVFSEVLVCNFVCANAHLKLSTNRVN